MVEKVLHRKEELEDTKGAIIIRISKNRQRNGQKKNHKRIKDRVTRTPLKTRGELRCSDIATQTPLISRYEHRRSVWVSSFCFTIRKSSEISRLMKEELDSDYDKRNLWHRYSISKQWRRPLNVRSEDFNLITKNPGNIPK